MLSPPWPSLSGQTTAASLGFSVSLTSSPSVVLTEKLVFQVQDVSISTFWWSPFIQPSQPLWSDHSRAVNLPPWRRQSRRPTDNTGRKSSAQRRLPLFAPSSLITVCCLEVFVYVCWHLAQCWHLICVNDIYHSSVHNSPMWDVMLDTVVLAQKY